MSALGKELANLARQPGDQRVRGLKRIIPWATVKAILKRHGYDRQCPRLPKWFMVWFVIGMGLCCGDCYRQIYRWLQCFRRDLPAPGKASLCEARRRLGVAPLRRLFDQVVRLLATPATPGAFYRDLRLMALDGFVVDVPDSPDNARAFGRPGGGRAAAAFPQVRVLTLCEIGTHILWKCLAKPSRRAEISMAAALLRFLTPGMLLLWDRGFFSYAHVAQVRRRGTHLLARGKTNLVFRDRRRLPDGSYLAELYADKRDRRRGRNGLVVRVIDYTFDDPGRPGSGQRHRLLTTLLDCQRDPAAALVALYHERWEEELAIDELKTHQRQRPVLRSQSPAGVVQELYGLLLGHYVVRRLLGEAAATRQLAPRRLSFTAALKILRCRLPECPRGAAGRRRWYADLLAEIAEEVVEERRDRINPRVIKRKMSKWLKKRRKHRHHPQPTKKFHEAIVIET